MALRKTIGLARVTNRLYIFEKFYDTDTSSYTNSVSVTETDSVFDLWHFRLGHASDSVLHAIKNDFPSISFKSNIAYDHRHTTKQTKLPFPNFNHRTDSSFSLIHVDIWGPLKNSCLHDHRYFLTIVEDHSRYTWVFFMKSKSEARSLLQNFIIYVKTQFNLTVKCVRSDNGLEFAMHDFYNQYGIVHQTSCVETPEQLLKENTATF
jgi:hypothetical protein